jgi:hypothetical protein
MWYQSNIFFEELLYRSIRKKNKMGDLLLVEAVVGAQSWVIFDVFDDFGYF